MDFSNVSDVAVRINSVSSGLAEDDLVALAEAEKPPMTLMLPKVDTCEEALWFASTMKTVYKKWCVMELAPVIVEAYMEEKTVLVCVMEMGHFPLLRTFKGDSRTNAGLHSTLFIRQILIIFGVKLPPGFQNMFDTKTYLL